MSGPTINFHRRMRPRRAGLLAVLLLALTLFAPGSHAAQGSAADTVHGFYEALLGIMQHAQQLGQRGRYAALAPLIDKTFDVTYMTRVAVGSSWASFPETQQHQLRDAFARYMAATYADRFDGYAGEKLEVIGEQSLATGVLVRSQIIKSNGEPVKISYLMRRNGESWQIADVLFTDTISELATRRSEFSSILRSQGIEGLLATLSRKTDLLIAKAGS